MTPLPGLFVSFEGIDGAGKSTHIVELAALFKAQGRAVTLTREPGGTLLAEKIRALVLNDAMDPLTETLLIFAARRDHLLTVIRPALARGDVVLCDRFTDASFAYQGGGRGFDWDVLNQLELWVHAPSHLNPNSADDCASSFLRTETALTQPVLTLWFDLSPEEAAKRLAGTRLPDKFEAQPVEFFRRVADGYARRERGDPQRFMRINAAQSPQAVWHEVRTLFVARGWLA